MLSVAFRYSKFEKGDQLWDCGMNVAAEITCLDSEVLFKYSTKGEGVKTIFGEWW